MSYTFPDCYGNTQPHDSNDLAEREHTGYSVLPAPRRFDLPSSADDVDYTPQVDASEFYVPTREEVEAVQAEEARKQRQLDAAMDQMDRVFGRRSSLNSLI